jgi:SAM-dependent MidA family methyltransferase
MLTARLHRFAKQCGQVERLLLHNELAQLIRDRIRARGPQPFAWFMQQALYHPEHGYYASGRAAIGRRGDYFTNVSVGPLFGQLLTVQFAEIWERLGSTDNFTMVEQGANDGVFARDVLECARDRFPKFFAALRYRIVEPFPILQDRQSQTLEGRAPSRPGARQRSCLQSYRDKVEWHSALSAREKLYPHLNPLPEGEEDATAPGEGKGVGLGEEDQPSQGYGSASAKRQVRVAAFQPFVGVHFSNELLDALPVNLRGKRVDLDGDEFVFVECADAPETKLNQAALDWVDKVAMNLQRGVVVAIDYGFTRSAFDESLQVRSQHRHLSSPFEQIGHADIAMHVNWTDIAERAEANGLHIAGFADQHHFLTGILAHFSELTKNAKAKRELQTLLHPEMLGRAFQVLALSKDVDADRLCGFQFARDPRITLELT